MCGKKGSWIQDEISNQHIRLPVGKLWRFSWDHPGWKNGILERIFQNFPEPCKASRLHPPSTGPSIHHHLPLTPLGLQPSAWSDWQIRSCGRRKVWRKIRSRFLGGETVPTKKVWGKGLTLGAGEILHQFSLFSIAGVGEAQHIIYFFIVRGSFFCLLASFWGLCFLSLFLSLCWEPIPVGVLFGVVVLEGLYVHADVSNAMYVCIQIYVIYANLYQMYNVVHILYIYIYIEYRYVLYSSCVYRL